jgi:flagellar basal-body rod protein FlgF
VLSAGGTTISVPQGSVPTIKENGDVLVDGSTVDTIGMFKLQGPIDRQGNALFSPAAVSTGTDLRAGTTVATDNPMDVLPEGDLFLGVETAAGPAYTRNGKIEVSPDGQLQVMGHAVLSAGGTTISVPQGSVPTIKENGDVLVDGSTVDTIGMFKLQGPIDRQGNALFSPAAGATAEAIDGAKLQIGTIELGNVPALESTVAMIGAQRHFETAMQAIQTYKKLDERAIEVGKVR